MICKSANYYNINCQNGCLRVCAHILSTFINNSIDLFTVINDCLIPKSSYSLTLSIACRSHSKNLHTNSVERVHATRTTTTITSNNCLCCMLSNIVDCEWCVQKESCILFVIPLKCLQTSLWFNISALRIGASAKHPNPSQSHEERSRMRHKTEVE